MNYDGGEAGSAGARRTTVAMVFVEDVHGAGDRGRESCLDIVAWLPMTCVINCPGANTT